MDLELLCIILVAKQYSVYIPNPQCYSHTELPGPKVHCSEKALQGKT